jgi:tetratricopeptide (TPR) repeat protein
MEICLTARFRSETCLCPLLSNGTSFAPKSRKASLLEDQVVELGSSENIRKAKDKSFGLQAPGIACRFALCGFFLLVLFCGDLLAAKSPNRLYRMEVQNKEKFTRLVFVFASAPRYRISHVAGRKVILTFEDTRGPVLKKFGAYADSRIEGLQFTDQGTRLRLTFTAKEAAPGFRFLDVCLPNVLSLDVGGALQLNGIASMPHGRDQIWKGADKLIHDFDPPLLSEIPFYPTPGPLISKLLSGEDLKLFLRGENLLYREKGAEAEEIFTGFLNKQPSMRAIAAYRLGEAQYQLQKYDSALRWFREGEKIWPDYLVQSPSMVFAYADTLGRCGESVSGRKILERMIVGMSQTKYGPVLLVRLADISARGGHLSDAVAVYRTVAKTFTETRAAYLAATRLADQRLFAVNSTSYRSLADEYFAIHKKTGDPVLKEETLFKSALITSMYGPADAAVSSIAEYLKKFPAGIFANVAATMREDLLLLLYRELAERRDCKGLVKLVLENRSYLARCVGEKDFIPHVSGCFKKLGMAREELEVFSAMADTAWVGPNESFLYFRIHDDAWALGKIAMAEAAGKLYLSRYPADSHALQIRERVGWIQFRNGDMGAAITSLSPLLNEKSKALDPSSYYYLGKACEKIPDLARARKAMGRYLASLPPDTNSALTADARIVIASAQLARRENEGALQTYRAGFESSRGNDRDMFLYKMGEACLILKKSTDARSHWEQLVREGKDPVWKSLAIQALADLSWREEWQQ